MSTDNSLFGHGSRTVTAAVQQQSAIQLRRWLLEAAEGGPIADITQSMLRAYYIRCGKNATTGLPAVPHNARTGLPFARRLEIIATTGVRFECPSTTLNEPAITPAVPLATAHAELDPAAQPRNLLRTLQLAALNITSAEQLTAPPPAARAAAPPPHTRRLLPLKTLLRTVATNRATGSPTQAPWAESGLRAVTRYLTSVAPPPPPQAPPPPPTADNTSAEPEQQPDPPHHPPQRKDPATHLLITPALAARLPPHHPLDPTQRNLNHLLEPNTCVTYHTGHTLSHPSTHVSHPDFSPYTTYYLPQGEAMLPPQWRNADICAKHGRDAAIAKRQQPKSRKKEPALRDIRRARPPTGKPGREADEFPVILLAKRTWQDALGKLITQYLLQFGGGSTPMKVTRTAILQDLDDGYKLESTPHQLPSAENPRPTPWDPDHTNWPENSSQNPDTALWTCTYKPMWENEEEANINVLQARHFEEQQPLRAALLREAATDSAQQRKETADAARVADVKSYVDISTTQLALPAAIPNVRNRPACAHPELDTIATGRYAAHPSMPERGQAEHVTALHAPDDGRVTAIIHTATIGLLYDRFTPHHNPPPQADDEMPQAPPPAAPGPPPATPPTVHEYLRNLAGQPASAAQESAEQMSIVYRQHDDSYAFYDNPPRSDASDNATTAHPTHILPASRLADLWRRHAAATLATPPPPNSQLFPAPFTPHHHPSSFCADVS